MGSSNNGCGGVDLPEDVTIEILSRLPVKSLLRFKCVCKSWRILVKHPNFISKQMHQKNQKKNGGLLLVSRYNDIRDATDFLLFPDESLAMPTYQNLELSFPVFPLVSSPCNGILCLCNNRDHMALWNPATRQFRALPLYNPDFPPHWTPWHQSFGFGLDPITNDYKVVWIRIFSDERKSYGCGGDTRHVAVYTLSTNSWRDFKGQVPGPHIWSCDLYINGVCYWRRAGEGLIISFHMGHEEFREVSGPPLPERSFIITLASYNGCIAVISSDLVTSVSEEQWVHVWVMVDQPQEQARWSKQLSIGPFGGIERVFGFWKNGDIFVRTSTGQLVLYDCDAKVRQDFGPLGSNNAQCLGVFIYSESLVSAKGGNNESQEHEEEEEDISSYMARLPEFFVGLAPRLVCHRDSDEESVDFDSNYDSHSDSSSAS